MKLYSSSVCSSCLQLFAYMIDHPLDVEKVDITESMANLREFLALRDQRAEFAPIRESGAVGIHCLLTDDDRILFGKAIEALIG